MSQLLEAMKKAGVPKPVETQATLETRKVVEGLNGELNEMRQRYDRLADVARQAQAAAEAERQRAQTSSEQLKAV